MDIIEKKSVVRKQAYHFLRHSVIALAVAATFGRAALADDSVSTVAAPQQKSDTDSNSGSVQSLEKVTVTSEFRTEDLQDVPSTINVIGGNTIRDNEVRNTQDLILYVPNMSADTSDEHGRPKFYIRGLGLSDASVWNTSPVGVYQDDVYIWNSSTLGFPLFDLERVEVLSGPQGTLYGKNTTAGTVNVISKKPSFKSDGYAKVSIGDYGDKLVEAAGGGALNDKFAVRASVQSEQSDLFQQNPQVPGTLIWRDSAARFQVLGKLSDTLTALVNVHVRLFDGPDSYGGGNLVTPVPGQSEFSSPAFRNSTETQTADGVTLTLNKVFDSGNILTSITDRSNYGESQAGESGTGVTTDSGLTRSKWDVNQFSQEFRLTSPAEQQLSWILGAYYFNGSIASDSENGTFSNLNQTSSAITAAAYGDDTYGIKNTDYAVFGHGDWKFNQKLDLALGLRYTIDQKTGSLLYASNLKPTAAGGITTGTNGNNIVTTSSPTDWWNPSNVVQTLYTVAQDSKSRTWNGLTYDITPSYQVTDDLKVYFRNAKSFNAGNFNATATTQATVATIEPEYVNSFEIGEKSQWLNNRLTVDGDVFYYLYTNIQQKVQVVNPVQANASVTSFTNNADGIGEGVELSITYLPTDNLKLSTNIGLNETRFTFFPLIPTATAPATSATGNWFNRVPRNMSNVGVNYKYPLGDGGKLVFDTIWAYQSKEFFNAVSQSNFVAGDPLVQNPYWLGNVSVGYVAPQKKYELLAYAKNVTNTTYLNTSLAGGSFSYGAPRTFGITGIVRW